VVAECARPSSLASDLHPAHRSLSPGPSTVHQASLPGCVGPVKRCRLRHGHRSGPRVLVRLAAPLAVSRACLGDRVSQTFAPSQGFSLGHEQHRKGHSICSLSAQLCIRFCHVVIVRRWVCSGVCRARAPCAVAGPISGWIICGGARCISSVARIKCRCFGQRTCKALQTRGRGRTLPQCALCGKSGKEPRNDKHMGHHCRDCIRGTLIGVRARVCTGVLEQKNFQGDMANTWPPTHIVFCNTANTWQQCCACSFACHEL
jgi:hypothetical protein